MVAADKKELGRYLRWIADEIGLRDWHFQMSVTDDLPTGAMEYNDEDGELEPLGSCMPIPGRRAAIVKFLPRIRDEKREEVRELIVHELVHCHFGQLREIPRCGLGKHLSQATYDVFMHAFDLQWEHTIDALSRALAKKMPLISWPSKGE